MAGSATPLLLVVAALLQDEQGRVLLTQRRPGSHLALTWEFPGGKVEPGETPEEALVRELAEELGIVVATEDLSPWGFASHPYERFHLLMPLFSCRHFSGEPQPLGVHDLKWFARKSLAGLDLPPADRPLVARLIEQGI
ncbi:MAG: (deoxy)nucleoside triphosphate pyrophosphohydrolase [Magnetococcales bacterium]|nr:(deoxy)nucleoside triphosphate pyrophosphohydrolase [Magnetococcales bacterium]